MTCEVEALDALPALTEPALLPISEVRQGTVGGLTVQIRLLGEFTVVSQGVPTPDDGGVVVTPPRSSRCWR